MGCLHQTPSLKQKKSREECNSPEVVDESIRNSTTGADLNSQRLWQHTEDLHGFKRVRALALRGESVPDIPRSYLQFISSGKKKISFLVWSVTVYINHTLGQALGPGVVGQYKINSIFLLFVFLLFL